MGATNGIGLLWPELTDSADGPDAFSKLANGVEDYFFDRILPAGVTRMPSYYWGSGSSFPNSVLLRAGDTFTHSQMGLCTYDGAAWLPEGPYMGKVWRTAGFSGTIAPNSGARVDLNAGRLSPGFTANYTAGASGLILPPYDGLYEVSMRAYVSGGSNVEAGTAIFRTRASVADIAIFTTVDAKASANDKIHMLSDIFPLKGGDTLFLRFDNLSNSSTGTTYFGQTEAFGVMLSARYVAPLPSGTSPL